MPFKVRAAASVAPLAAAVAATGVPSPGDAHPFAPADIGVDTSGAVSGMSAPSAVAGHEMP